MRYKPFVSLFILCLSMMLLWQTPVFACQPMGGLTGFFHFPFGFYWRSAPPKNQDVGQPITEWLTLPYRQIYRNCAYKNGVLRIGLQVGNSTATHPIAGTYQGHTIFPTMVHGTGFIIAVKSNIGNAPQEPAEWRPIAAPGGFLYGANGVNIDLFTGTGAPLPGTSFYASVRMRMIQTYSDFTSPSTSTVQNVNGQGGFYAGDDANVAKPHMRFTWFVQLRRDGQLKCTISMPDPVIPLGNYNIDQFIAIGSRSPRKGFRIGLTNCTSVGVGNSVSFSMSGIPDRYSPADSGVLQVNGPDDPLTTRGVGVEVVHRPLGGQITPVVIDKKIFFKKVRAGESADLEFFANYVKNADPIRKPGNANATATFLIYFEQM